MNFKKTWKRFFSLSRRNDGFTLVELIVVIAILAILAGVGVPAYSGYVTKTNMAADQALFAEIEKAIHLAYYSDTDTFDYGFVSLTTTGAAASTPDLIKAMEATFGEGWETTCALKYDSWTSSVYQNSSFSGNEPELLSKVDSLTDALSSALASSPTLVGANFTNFLTSLGVTDTSNTDAVADAAVLYVAQSAKDIDREAAIKAMSGIAGSEAADAIGTLSSYYGGSVAGAAALYAVAVSYCEYEAANGNSTPLTTLNNATFNVGESADPINTVMAVFGDVAKVANQDTMKEYFKEGGQVATDMEAYLDILDTVNGAQSTILSTGTLGSENFFSSDTITNMFGSIASGGTLVTANSMDGTLYVDHPAKTE